MKQLERLQKILKNSSVKETPCTGGSVGQALGCHVKGSGSNPDQINTQDLKITEEKVLPL